MIERTFKFETEEDAESFISSITASFNATGKEKSVHANTIEREGNTVFFTRQSDTSLTAPADLGDPVETEYLNPPVTSDDVAGFVEDVQGAADAGLLDGQEVEVDLSESVSPSSEPTGEVTSDLGTSEEPITESESQEN